MSEEIRALYADDEGEIFDAPGFAGLGRTGSEAVLLQPEDLIPLPESADLMFLPDRLALGQTPQGECMPITGRAVAAILPAGYTRKAATEFIHTYKETSRNGHSTDLQHHRKCSPHP